LGVFIERSIDGQNWNQLPVTLSHFQGMEHGSETAVFLYDYFLYEVEFFFLTALNIEVKCIYVGT